MRTRKYKLKINGASCKFWLMLFENEEKMNDYVLRTTGWLECEDGLGAGCCLANKKTREIIICLCSNWCNEYVIGHEVFHATVWYMKLNRRRYTQSVWKNIWEGWCNLEKKEEELADVCGCIYTEIKAELGIRFKIKTLDNKEAK